MDFSTYCFNLQWIIFLTLTLNQMSLCNVKGLTVSNPQGIINELAALWTYWLLLVFWPANGLVASQWFSPTPKIKLYAAISSKQALINPLYIACTGWNDRDIQFWLVKKIILPNLRPRHFCQMMAEAETCLTAEWILDLRPSVGATHTPVGRSLLGV